MRVLVCGSRHFQDYKLLKEVLDEVNKETEITDIIHGNAPGVDGLGALWARSHRRAEDRYIRLWKFPADWETYGKAAGPIRNKQMLDEGKPDLVVAFLAENSRGTKNMIEQATKAGVPVKVINV